ncbi:MAG TPA: class II fumarate hydratase [Nitrososphaerales archaeon]|nr:class II fumarate hydratase [Nitrososphaerales archaeon]
MRYVEGARKVFMDTGTRFPRKLIWSVALIKREAAKANSSLGRLDPNVSSAIVQASNEVMEGKHDSKVLVDVFQTGSGTGLNMNVNELIAERAGEILGRTVHANDHVNMSQSSNDVGPSAIRISAVALSTEELVPAMSKAAKGLSGLGRRTSAVYKVGRTHLRDALPVTMGQEFDAYADAFEHDLALLRSVLAYARELPLGGTAVGTGLNANPKFGAMVIRGVNDATKLAFSEARSRFRAMRLLSDLVALSSVLNLTAIDLYRLCQDIRLMFSGPVAGLNEVEIPTQEEVAGSSIMPGKTNPVTVEAAMLVAVQVMGLDRSNQAAGMLGEFELSMGVPLVGYNVATQIVLLSEAMSKLSSLVLDHIVPNVKKNRLNAESSPALITAISPEIGYDKAAKVGKKLQRGLSIRDGLKQLGYTEREVDKILDLRALVGRSTGK